MTSSATPSHVVLCDPPVTFARAEAPDDPSGAGSSRAPPKSRFFFDEANDWVIAHEEETVAHEEDDALGAGLGDHGSGKRGDVLNSSRWFCPG